MPAEQGAPLDSGSDWAVLLGIGEIRIGLEDRLPDNSATDAMTRDGSAMIVAASRRSHDRNDFRHRAGSLSGKTSWFAQRGFRNARVQAIEFDPAGFCGTTWQAATSKN